MELLTLVTDVGFPIAAALVGMYFVYLTVKFLLDSVLERVNSLIETVKQLDKRLTSMSSDILCIDMLVSKVLELPLEESKVIPKERKD